MSSADEVSDVSSAQRPIDRPMVAVIPMLALAAGAAALVWSQRGGEVTMALTISDAALGCAFGIGTVCLLVFVATVLPT